MVRSMARAGQAARRPGTAVKNIVISIWGMAPTAAARPAGWTRRVAQDLSGPPAALRLPQAGPGQGKAQMKKSVSSRIPSPQATRQLHMFQHSASNAGTSSAWHIQSTTLEKQRSILNRNATVKIINRYSPFQKSGGGLSQTHLLKREARSSVAKSSARIGMAGGWMEPRSTICRWVQKCASETGHRQVKYLNTVVKAGHGKLKQPIRPVRGFKTLKTVYATIRGFGVMRTL
ncbi:Transposase [Azospirillum palustre]